MVNSSEQPACDAILTQSLLTEFGADMRQLRNSAQNLKARTAMASILVIGFGAQGVTTTRSCAEEAKTGRRNNPVVSAQTRGRTRTRVSRSRVLKIQRALSSVEQWQSW
jgi:altronate dehydratase